MAHIVEYINRPMSDACAKLQDEILLKPLNHLRQVKGKGMAGLVVKAFNYWLKVPADVLDEIVDLTNLLHETSLLLDDVEDNSVLRRGLPAAHLVYGVPSVVNASCYLIFLALERTMKLGHSEAVDLFVDEALETHRGQGMDIYWRENFICPTKEEYLDMIKLKTNLVFHVRLLQLFSENKHNYTKLAEKLSRYFQIRDDYCNLCDQSYADRKTYCEDLTEGKFSFPIIHAIKSKPDDTEIMHILRMRTTDNALKKYCLSLIRERGSLQYTYDALTRLDKELREETEALGGNPWLIDILNKLYTWK